MKKLASEQMVGQIMTWAAEIDPDVGMFLYARLVMDNLRDQPTKNLFDEERAKKFPEGLSEA